MIIVIDNYDSFTYNLVHYLGELGQNVQVYRNDKITINKISKLKPKGIVISPGPKTPKEAGISIPLVKSFYDKIPILGVCLGHQTIGAAFGGKIVSAIQIMHGKTSLITHTKSQIFKNIPTKFKATRYHSLVVEKRTVPKSLKITATSKDGMIMALEHIKYPVYGIQFHPESIASEHGHKLLKNFINLL
tara:strand:- start:189 stop:755 length:567 start_codon:yes stop_codon:yes gene_type:complete